ncbi:FAD binding domain protein [Xylariaceae sp. FL0255]|nr:FAD binding domain protein [Xylariaceae sp. FL0255]
MIIIIGSCVTGLATAAILRAQLYDVIIFERGDIRIVTGGQGMIISPAAVKILESVGFDAVRVGAVPMGGVVTFDYWGENMLEDKRNDFREELLRLATAPPAEEERQGQSGKPARLVLQTSVIDLDPEEGQITLQDGSQVTADVAIGEIKKVADGIHSSLRHAALGDDQSLPARWNTAMAGDTASMTNLANPSGRVIALYPLRNRSYINFSLIVRTQDSSRETTEYWYADGCLSRALEIFKELPDPLIKILSVATEVKEWKLQEPNDIPTWSLSRALLVGDAAHAMTPVQGLGAAMAIEDAEALKLLAQGTSRDDVSAILDLISDENRRANAGMASVGERLNNNKDLYYGYKGIDTVLKASSG